MEVNFITGEIGKYTQKIADKSVRYGRNAISNYNKALKPLENDFFDFNIDKANPIDSAEELLAALEKDKAKESPMDNILKYLPGKVDFKNLDTKALLGASFEDLGKKVSKSLNDLNKTLKNAFGRSDISAEAFDINGDGKIDIAENAAALLIKDMAGKTKTHDVLNSEHLELVAHNIDGTINNTGETNFSTFLKESNVQNNKKIVSSIYDAFDLGTAKKEFLKDSNNLVD